MLFLIYYRYQCSLHDKPSTISTSCLISSLLICYNTLLIFLGIFSGETDKAVFSTAGNKSKVP